MLDNFVLLAIGYVQESGLTIVLEEPGVVFWACLVADEDLVVRTPGLIGHDVARGFQIILRLANPLPQDFANFRRHAHTPLFPRARPANRRY